MELKVADRLTLLGLLPKSGNFLNMKLVREIKEELSFSEDEHVSLSLVLRDDTVVWDAEKDTGKEIKMGEVIKSIIRGELEKLDKDEKLEERHMSIYEKFMEV